MSREIAKSYDPQQIEPRWAESWVKEELFKADPSTPGPAFCVVIPPRTSPVRCTSVTCWTTRKSTS